MSYILEALKKSQAERQLGELPSIHAPQVQLQPAPDTSGQRRLPLWIATGAACAVAAAWWWWPAPVVAPAPAPVAAVAPVAAAPVAVPAPAPVPVIAPLPAPVVVKAAPPAPVVNAVTPPPVPVPVPVPVPAPAPVPAPSEEITPGLRDLPEPIQRQIPPVALGGYMYSKDPADRLLLIDKVLRHEGEEVAPGLVLEKLQPKAAIFSFKGYRYRVPY